MWLSSKVGKSWSWGGRTGPVSRWISRASLGERKGEIERGERELGSLQKLARQHGLGHNPSFLPFLFPAWFTQGLSEFNFMFSGSLSAIALNETPLLKLFEKYFSAEQ